MKQDEIRTHRLVIVDEDGVDRVVIGVDRGVVELRIMAGADGNAAVSAYAGPGGPGEHTAGVILWSNGNALGGSAVVVVDGVATFSRFPD